MRSYRYLFYLEKVSAVTVGVLRPAPRPRARPLPREADGLVDEPGSRPTASAQMSAPTHSAQAHSATPPHDRLRRPQKIDAQRKRTHFLRRAIIELRAHLIRAVSSHSQCASPRRRPRSRGLASLPTPTESTRKAFGQVASGSFSHVTSYLAESSACASACPQLVVPLCGPVVALRRGQSSSERPAVECGSQISLRYAVSAACGWLKGIGYARAGFDSRRAYSARRFPARRGRCGTSIPSTAKE